MGMEFTNGPMDVYIKEIGIKIRFPVMENIIGMMEEHIKDIGLITTCMEKVCTCGQMVESMKVNM